MRTAMKRIFTGLVLFALAKQPFAADLFPDGKLRQINAGDQILASDTVGGYPIFQDDGRWKFVRGRESSSTGGSSPIKMGSVLLDYFQGTSLLARQSVLASLNGGGMASSWTGSPCSPDHLIVRNKGQGMQDNCMTIDPSIVTLGTVPSLFLTIVLTNSGSSGRYYQLSLLVSAELLGVRNTGLGDWTKEAIAAKPQKQKALERLTAWAEQLHEGSIRAFEFAKPQNVYERIPSLMSLLPVPNDLAGQKRSISFLSAVEDLRYQPTFSSIAYSPWEDYRGNWSSVNGHSTQETADAAALANCETNRKINRPNAPLCETYRLKAEKPSSSLEDTKSRVIGDGKPITDSTNTQQKLEKLKDLFSKGLISKDQYDAQVKDVLRNL
jgi:hypothetical protein